MAEKSTHYNLDILKGNDIYNPNIAFDNFEKIDTDMYKIDTNAVHSAVHILSGSVNTLTRTNTDFNIFKFVATAPYTANQTFTVDGQQVSAYTTNGQPLDTNCYVIGATVLCALNGSILTLFVRSSGTVENSLLLNNHPDTYFAVKGDTTKTLKDVDELASRAISQANVANTNANSKISQKFLNCPIRNKNDDTISNWINYPSGLYWVGDFTTIERPFQYGVIFHFNHDKNEILQIFIGMYSNSSIAHRGGFVRDNKWNPTWHVV